MRRGILPVLLLAIALADLVFLALPTLVVLIASFTPGNIVAFPPEGFSLRWYAHLAGKPDFLAALWRSLQVGLVCTLLAIPAGTLAAHAASIRATSALCAFFRSRFAFDFLAKLHILSGADVGSGSRDRNSAAVYVASGQLIVTTHDVFLICMLMPGGSGGTG